MPTFRDTKQEELHFRRTQQSQYSHAYTLVALCPATSTAVAAAGTGTITRAILENEDDADFLIGKISGSVEAPVNANGQPEILFPGAGNWLAPACAAGRMMSGLSLRITNLATGLNLTARYQPPPGTLQNDFIPVELILTPGYGFSMYRPTPFQYLLLRNEKLLFEFRNRDSSNPALYIYYHRICMSLIGQRMES